MRRVELSRPDGVRWVPESHSGVGVLVVAGSSGRVDGDRARVFAGLGCLAESIRWFGGADQQAGPFDVPLETFVDRVDALAADCDRIVLVGLSFGAEGVLAAASRDPRVHGVVAFAPSDVVWAGVDPTGRETSHWTVGGVPVPWMPLDWTGFDGSVDPPAFRPVYERSRRTFADRLPAAAIRSERIPEVVLVVGGDDRVWPSDAHADSIVGRRARSGLETTVIRDAAAGHRAILPGEPEPPRAGPMQRGGTEAADRALGLAAWPALREMVRADPRVR